MIKGEWFGGKTSYIDSVSGKLATQFTPKDTKISITNPNPHTILHWVDKDDPTTQSISKEDIQYENWEYGVRTYIEANLGHQLEMEYDVPTEYDDVHNAENTVDAFDFAVKNIFDVEYGMQERLNIEIELEDLDEDDVESIEYRINNLFTGFLESFGNFSFKPEDAAIINELNTLSITILDNKGNKVTRDAEFKVLLTSE